MVASLRAACLAADVVFVACVCLTAFPPLSAVARSKPLVQRVNAFACDLYDQLKTREGNLVVSPYSISAALAIAYAGARGETAEQMARTLHYPRGQESLSRRFSDFQTELVGPEGETGPEVQLANALWVQEAYPLREEYLQLVTKSFRATVNTVDFENEQTRERACGRINDWVSEKTRGKIDKIVAPGQLADVTRLVVTNAVYFLGDWEHRFSEAITQQRAFWTAPDVSIDVPTMSQTETFRFAPCESLSVLEMDFAGRQYTTVILLPEERDGLARIEKGLGAETLAAWLSCEGSRKVEVHLPKFKLESSFQLQETLAAMGMPIAFHWPGADFSGMTDHEDLFIGMVTHKAFIEVSERGAEAAAATAIGIRAGVDRLRPDPPVVFRADHPFLYLIRHRPSGCILFLGRVVDPDS